MGSHDRRIDVHNQSVLRSCEVIQEIQGMGADALLTVNEDELCQRLVRKYQREFPLNGEGSDQSEERQSLADTIRRNLVERKANFFSGLTPRRGRAAKSKAA